MFKIFLFSLFTLIFSNQVLGQAEEIGLLGHWNDTTIIPSPSFNQKYNECWGVAFHGKEYGIIGSVDGTHFIDITEPTHPVEVAKVPGKQTGAIVIHRDYHNFGKYLYVVCDEGHSSLQIIDMSFLPDSVSVVYDSDEKFRTSHNIFIDTTLQKLYVFAVQGGDGGYDPLRIYDLSETPENPVKIGSYSNFAGINPSHIHDGYVDNGIAYLNLGYSGFAIMDYSDPENPIALGSLTSYSDKGYNHSGWATHDNNYYFMADENHGNRMKVLDVSDPEDIQEVAVFDAGSAESKSIPHNQIIACDYLFVSYYYDGLQIFDISDPANPKLKYYFDTYSEENKGSYKGAWGVYPFLPSGNILLSDMQTGLYIFNGLDDNCDDFESIDHYVDYPTGVSNFFENSIDIFPNPTHGQFQINFENDLDFDISLIDIYGKKVFETSRTSQEKLVNVKVENLGSGMYFIILENEKLTIHKKLEINK